MHPSDDELRQALTREDPPAGFADRVMVKARQLDAERRQPARWRLMAAAAAVAGVIVTAGAGVRVYQRQVQQAEVMRAKEDVMRALRVTSEKLRTARAQVQQIERKRFEVNE
jgi:hypothetical protein